MNIKLYGFYKTGLIRFQVIAISVFEIVTYNYFSDTFKVWDKRKLKTWEYDNR